jgi:hypothetical protein
MVVSQMYVRPSAPDIPINDAQVAGYGLSTTSATFAQCASIANAGGDVALCRHLKFETEGARVGD